MVEWVSRILEASNGWFETRITKLREKQTSFHENKITLSDWKLQTLLWLKPTLDQNTFL